MMEYGDDRIREMIDDGVKVTIIFDSCFQDWDIKQNIAGKK